MVIEKRRSRDMHHDRKSRGHRCRPLISNSQRIAIRALCVSLLLAIYVTSAAPQGRKATEADVKAAYLFNFGKFIKWPPASNSAGSAFTICILGRDPFGPVLDATVSGERINGKNASVRRIDSVRQVQSCQILFISSSEESRLKTLLPELNPGVLTVSDVPHFLDRGGMVQFVLDGNRVRFEVNLAAAEKAGLTLSSELLKVATNVRKGS